MTFEQMFKLIILVMLVILFLGAICSVGAAAGSVANDVSEWPVTCTPDGCPFETPTVVCSGHPPDIVPCVWPTIPPPPTMAPGHGYPYPGGYPPASQVDGDNGAIWLPLLFGGE